MGEKKKEEELGGSLPPFEIERPEGDRSFWHLSSLSIADHKGPLGVLFILLCFLP